MRCSSCGSTAVSAATSVAPRCLNCGTPLDVPKPAEKGHTTATAAKHTYATPFGRLVAQVQKSGSWAAGSFLVPVEGRTEAAVILVKNLLSSWKKLDHPALPKLHSFDEKDLCCAWALPNSAGWVPLASLHPPLAPAEVNKLIIALAAPLELLHKLGLGAFDLSPSVIFVAQGLGRATFIPTLWLASMAHWSPGKVTDMAFVAPELDHAREAYPDPIRADVYSLGALAWFLLTSQERKGTTQLPSEFSRDLAPWDSFIDGCCRSNPARRFESVTIAVRSLDGFATPDHPARAAQTIPPALPVRSSGPQINEKNSQEVGPEKTQPRGSRRIRRVTVGVLLAVVVLGIYLRREKVAELFPSASGFLLPYQRGFGDTILKYKDRSYEGSAWRKLAEAQALDTGVEGHQRFSGLTGWDADNFVVVTQGAFGPVSVLRMRGGAWQVFARLTSSHANGNTACPRLLDADTLVVACGYYGYFFGKVTLGGVEDYGEVLQGQNNQPYTIPVDRDLFFFTATHSHNLGQAAKFEGGKLTKLDKSKHKIAFVHGEGNVPLAEYPVHHLTLSASYRAGRAVALCQSGSTIDEPILAECRDGIWYYLEALTKWTKYHAFWLGSDGAKPLFAVCVGDHGMVEFHDLTKSGEVKQNVSAAAEATEMKLIQVWGVSPEKYWVMDSRGTIWERSDNRWRLVVRGLREEDIEFKTAWISPEGTVLAITEKDLYRLD